jgi:hypothetical protein
MAHYTVEVNGEATVVFSFDGSRDEADLWVGEIESGVILMLSEHQGMNGRLLYDPDVDSLSVRGASDDEQIIWQHGIVRAEAAYKAEGWNDFNSADCPIFLVPARHDDCDEKEAA